MEQISLDHDLPLTWTAVIRPDDILDAEKNVIVKNIKSAFAAHYYPLKSHFCHCPDARPAHQSYSARTRKRLRHAESVFNIKITDIDLRHKILGDWQEALQKIRKIPLNSSPTKHHFVSLIDTYGDRSDSIAVVELNFRHNGCLCGALLLARAQGPDDSWHAHSLICQDEARAQFGTYLLFASAIDYFNTSSLWWGGQPTGANGLGVLLFKKRFSNASAPAHLLSIDLQPKALATIRTSRETYPWVPDYRDPRVEMRC